MCLRCHNCDQEYYCRHATRVPQHFDTFTVKVCDVNFQWIDSCFACDQPK